MDQELDIVVTGLDVAQGDAARGLAAAFDLSAAQAELFVRELPRVAKRRASESEAARYCAALRAIGVRVETQASTAPGPTLRARAMPDREPAQEFLDLPFEPISEPSGRGLVRATQGLSMISNPPPETLNPSFPKAPLVPHDMKRMPNQNLTSWRPDWLMNDALEQLDERPRRHTDAQMPPPLLLRDQSPAEAAAQARLSSPEMITTVGVVHHAAVSGRPGMRALSTGAAVDSPAETAAKHKRRALIGAGILIAVAALALGSQAYRVASDRRERVASMVAEGIEPGQHAEAGAWLSAEGHSVKGIEQPQLFTLLRRLQDGGAPSIWVARIVPVGSGFHARALIVEIPRETVARRTVLEHIARSRLHRHETDHGQRWELVDFSEPRAASPAR